MIAKKHLVVKRSTLPGAGKGLFTQTTIPKNSLIVEYKGNISTWKDVSHDEGTNGYIFYIDRNHVLDARPFKKALARYANDAKGLHRLKGVANNSTYEIIGKKVYIKAIKEIPAGGEIFVDYGKEYWDVIRYNRKIDQIAKKEMRGLPATSILRKMGNRQKRAA